MYLKTDVKFIFFIIIIWHTKGTKSTAGSQGVYPILPLHLWQEKSTLFECQCI